MSAYNKEEPANPFFTVFTPTFNRKHTLPRLIASLQNAGCVEFEWLVIDDGSSDGTYEWLIDLRSKLDFPVRVYRQENSGKQSCHNAAVALAKGTMIIILDSDDELAPRALNMLKESWDSIPTDKKHHFAGILGNSTDQNGCQIGNEFPESPMDGNHFLLTIGGIMSGDKLPCYRRDVLTRFPFPKIPFKQVVPEGIVWNRISKYYCIRCVNRNVAIVHRDINDKISLMNSYTLPSSNAYGKYMYFNECVEQFTQYNDIQFRIILIYSILCIRYGMHTNIGLKKLLSVQSGCAFLSILSFIGGVVFWAKDRTSEFLIDKCS